MVNVQVIAGVTVVDGVSAADTELSLYLDKAAQFIDDTLKGVADVPLNPAPEIISRVLRFWLAKNSLAENQIEHPKVALAEKKIAEFKASLDVLLS